MDPSDLGITQESYIQKVVSDADDRKKSSVRRSFILLSKLPSFRDARFHLKSVDFGLKSFFADFLQCQDT